MTRGAKLPPGYVCLLGVKSLPVFFLIMIRHCKDPYEAISIIECRKGLNVAHALCYFGRLGKHGLGDQMVLLVDFIPKIPVHCK